MRLVLRAKIEPAAAEGQRNEEIAADEPLSKTPCQIALLGLPVRLGKIGADAPIFRLLSQAPMCAAIFNRPDSLPPPF